MQMLEDFVSTALSKDILTSVEIIVYSFYGTEFSVILQPHVMTCVYNSIIYIYR